MPTNLAIDDKLIEEARRTGRHKTKEEAVTAALDEYVKAPQTAAPVRTPRHHRLRSGLQLQSGTST